MSVSKQTIEKHNQYQAKALEAATLYKSGSTLSELASKYGFDRDCFSKYLRNNGYIEKAKEKPPSIDKELLSLIYSKYCEGETSITDLAKQYGLNRKVLSRNLKKLYGPDCIRQDGRKPFDESYFEEIDNPEKAYWLGFFYADGYNSGREFEFCLQDKDKESVEMFKAAIKSQHTISQKRTLLNGKEFVGWKISIKSKKACTDLSKWGCIPGKTYNVTFPNNIPERLMPHFLRGYFDGDGSLSIYRRRKLGKASFTTASIEFAEGLSSWLSSKGFPNSIRKVRGKQNWDIVLSQAKKTLNDFYCYLYNDSTATTRLRRKYEKYQTLFYCRPKTKVA